MIEMKGFRVLVQTKADALLGYTGENLSRRMTIVVDEVGTWSYKLDLEFENGQKNILDLTAGDGVLYVDIERAHLAQDGSVRAQVRAIRGEEVRKSNVFLLRVMSSVDAVEYFEPLPPSEFEQMEARITALKAEVELLAASADESARGAAEALSKALESANAALSAARSAEADAESAIRAAGISEEAKTAAQAAAAASEEALTQSRLAVQAVENALAAATSAEAGAIDAANRAEAAAQGIESALKAAEDARDAARLAAQAAEDALKQLKPATEQALGDIRTEGDTQIKRLDETGAAALRDIAAAGDGQTARLSTEGDTQVQRVANEGAAQIKEATRQAGLAAVSASNAAGSEQRAGEHADRAVTAAIRQPYPSAETGTWWVWNADAGAYVDSGLKAVPDALRIASPDVLGGVQPVAKTDTMTIQVGVDSEGKLYSGKDPEVNQLRSDLSNKLPKSPTGWPDWTTDEQSEARERIGIPGDYELIEEITLTESVSEIYRNVDVNGNAYKLKKAVVFVETVSNGISGALRIFFNGALNYFPNGFSSGDAHKFAYAMADVSNGLMIMSRSKAMSAVNSDTEPLAQYINLFVPVSEITSISITRTGTGGVIGVGTNVKIYGVRA